MDGKTFRAVRIFFLNLKEGEKHFESKFAEKCDCFGGGGAATASDSDEL